MVHPVSPHPLSPSLADAARHDQFPDLLQPVPAAPLDTGVANSRTSGFPSPASDYKQRRLDITAYLVRHPAATFLFMVQGEALAGSDIHNGDILVVDKSLAPRPGQIVVVFVNGERLVKRLDCREGRMLLLSDNPRTPVLEVTKGGDLTIWGVVVGKFKRVPT